ncbi:hypothetical protein [Streptomyces sp. W1SF4]|uniref:hypothetical protein n=1 Tax=Streptomyces sp. W1SF4 TaxID=2305220 RepID=UPI000F6C9A98|nr:hypothetical protein [Streptomyces sp. W1SF4]AZM89714.1 hypothetical protein D1J60_15640 [Streptomyces sp. W1SF4]
MSRSRRIPLVLLTAALALTACGRIWNRPPPEGEAVALPQAELATTWTDADGGTLELGADGTFTAHQVCGDWMGASDWNWQGPRSGTGTWTSGTGPVGSAVTRRFDAKGPKGDEVADSLSVWRHGNTLMLWTRVGDEDNDDPHCILTRRP